MAIHLKTFQEEMELDWETVLEMYQLFQEDLVKIGQDLEAFEPVEVTSLRQAAHSLKGMALTYQAPELAALAGAVEKDLLEKPVTATLEKGRRQLQQSVAETLAELEQWLL